MEPQALGYFLFGLALSVTFLGIIVYYNSRKRRRQVEAPKYKMLEDDD